ncbi:uncharacterized protein FOMMEDRAFT_151430 [Fomitiporia mediterranea MF3/22]|uniref:uncharacterized protein n=1 Tax=Fomitiporia mediterranea (strain MF3/22) TaxID=694068 RepID=UPI0004408728|nr:uncharacterized protein FOMMEDRAFT_151430 [Fomitiporia mediterranea MF3/22]EJD08562.1 hypothetical protein FOMMEDRAFT_151430 [Fomitiporia mediterranea MF3/22]
MPPYEATRYRNRPRESGRNLRHFTVQPPFDGDPDADVILQSSDGVKFLVIKSILAHGSTFFKTMLTLPQPPNRAPLPKDPMFSTGSPTESGLPVIPMTESDAKTIDVFLRILYPITSPDIKDLNLVDSLLKVGVKYDFDLVVDRAKDELCNSIVRDEDNAIKVFGIACRYRLDDTARLASYMTLKKPFCSRLTPDFEELKMRDFYCLFDYYRKVVTAVRSLFLDEQSGVSYCRNITHSILDRSGRCPRSHRGEVITRSHDESGVVDVVEQVYFLGWWIAFRNSLYIKIAQGPASEKLVTFEAIWREVKACCPHCQATVEMDLRYGLADVVNAEIKRLINSVSLEIPWD